MSDIKISTKVTALHTPNPPQPGNPSEYFGDETNDLQLNNVNDLDLVVGLDRLKQDLNKVLMTELGANANFDSYGTTLQTLIGNKVDLDEIKGRVRDQVDTALSVLLLIHNDNENDDEVVDIFESMSVQELEPGKIEVRVSVISRSGKRAVSDAIIIV